MEIAVIVICLLFSAFFTGMEIALLASNKVYIGIEKLQDGFVSKIIAQLTQKTSYFITTMFIGNSLALVCYSYYSSALVMRWMENVMLNEFWKVFIQVLVATLLIVFTSKFLPRVFFKIHANAFVKVFAIPAFIFYKLFYYLAVVYIFIADVVMKYLFRIEYHPNDLLFTKMQLENYISEQMNAVDDKEKVDSEVQIFQNALEFSGVKVREIMNPRIEIAAVEIKDSVEKLKEVFLDTNYSKILVYENSLDEIIGYVHSIALFKRPKTIREVMISVEFVPETLYIKEAMDLLTKKRRSVAVVLDEYGGTSGMITLEDIVEQLFGDIEDEHDSEAQNIEEVLQKNCYRFSTRLKVDYLNETYNLKIPESDSYSTLGGYIVHYANEIPEKGEELLIDNLFFTIEEATNSKIEIVKMVIKE
jgi:putative hemolysin